MWDLTPSGLFSDKPARPGLLKERPGSFEF